MTNSSKEDPPSSPKDNEVIGGLISSSSSSSSTCGTPRRAIIPSGPGGSSGGGGSVKKKRGKKLDDQQQQQQGSAPKRKRGEMDAPKSEPICPIPTCRKKFASWKGVFGHLRAHPDRGWRGAFPPPEGDAAAWIPLNLPPEQILAPALLALARETLAKMRQEQSIGSSRVINFDLNVEPPEEPVDVAGPSLPPRPPPPALPPQGGLDLNLPPSQENEDEEMDHTDK